MILSITLLLIAVGCAIGTYWTPWVATIGVMALAAYAVERYITFKQTDWEDEINTAVRENVNKQFADLNLDKVKETANEAYKMAESANAKVSFSGR